MNNREERRILIVDDERINVIALAQILKPHYRIIVAIDGAGAIELAEKHEPDIILLDILMPDISGFDVLRRLKESERTRDIPVIFISGLDSAEDEETGLLLGAVDYITKPFHKSIVKARIGTHLKMAEYIRTIERLCMLDTLTELPNRRGFDSQMSAEWGRAVRDKTPLGLLMIDIDRFKLYNDTFGHPQGDASLQAVADVFRQTLNRPGDFAARWGGEEFAVLLPETDLSGALSIAEKMRAGVEQAMILSADGANASVTISIGAGSILPSADDAAPDFIASIDKALYRAKHTGRNRVCARQ